MKKEYKLYITVMNIVACLAVVFLHCNGIVHGFSNTMAWKGALVIEVLCYFAVPVFFMITGANLLSYRSKYDTKTFFKKRMLKVLVPYFVWSLIYYIVYFKQVNISDFFTRFFNCNIETVFWFFPAIITIYLLLPIFAELVDSGKENILKYFAILIFVNSSLIQYGYSIFNKSVPTIFNIVNGNSKYFLYVILGYFLSKTDVKKKNKYIIYISAICCLLFRYIYTYYFSIQQGVLNKKSWGYVSLAAVIPSIAVFILVKSINWNKLFKSEKSIKIVNSISSCSFGVYLIHILLKSKITKIFGLSSLSIYYRLLFPIALYIICLFIIYILKKIPIINKIVP